jgi:hypothetical protein
MLHTGSGDELCGLLLALFQEVAYHQPTVNPSAFPAFVYSKFKWRSAACFSYFLWCAFGNSIPLLCVSFQFVAYCLVFFLVGGGQFDQGSMLVYLMGGWGKTCWSAECPSSRFGASICWHISPPVFSL